MKASQLPVLEQVLIKLGGLKAQLQGARLLNATFELGAQDSQVVISLDPETDEYDISIVPIVREAPQAPIVIPR